MLNVDVKVFNSEAMENTRKQGEDAMNGRITEMETEITGHLGTVASLEAEIESLEKQASDQDEIATSAMITVYYTDSEGHMHSRSEPDSVKRIAAKTQANNLRSIAATKQKQVEALKRQIEALELAIDTLGKEIDATNAYVERVKNIVQQTDVSFAQMLDEIAEATAEFNAKIKALRNSFNDQFPLTSNDVDILSKMGIAFDKKKFLDQQAERVENITGNKKDPRNPNDDPWIAEQLFWEDLSKGEISYLQACVTLYGIYGDVSEEVRKKIAGNLVGLYAGNPKMVEVINKVGSGGFELPQNPVSDMSTKTNWGYMNSEYENTFGYPHIGEDFSGIMDVFVTIGGTVLAPSESASAGTNIRIEGNDGNVHIYAHLSSTLVSEGDTVRPGQQLGVSGKTGNATGNHLHYEIQRDGVWGSVSGSIDPNPILRP